MAGKITISPDVKEGDAVELIADKKGDFIAIPKRKAKTLTGPKWKDKAKK